MVSRGTWYLITNHEYADGKLLNKYTYDNPPYDNFFIFIIIGGDFCCTFLAIRQMNLSDRKRIK